MNCSATIFLSLNIPGVEKVPKGARTLFDWGCEAVFNQFAVVMFQSGEDSAGLYAIFLSDNDPVTLKKAAVLLEETNTAARLLDIDVYDRNCHQISRTRLNFKQRQCFLCDGIAVECVRTQKHAKDDIRKAAIRLLRTFKP